MARLKESAMDEFEIFYTEVIEPQELRLDIPSNEDSPNEVNDNMPF